MICALISSLSTAALVQLLIVLIVIGLVAYLVKTYILPVLAAPIQIIITVVFVLMCCLWLLRFAGLI